MRTQRRQERQAHGGRGEHHRHGNGVPVERRTRLFSRRKKRQIGLAQRGDGGEEQIEPAEPLRRAASQFTTLPRDNWIMMPNNPTASSSRARAYQEVNGVRAARWPAYNRPAESTNMAMAEMSTQ